MPADRWTRLTIRDGEKGPVMVDAVMARVHARLGRRIGPEERLLVIGSLDAVRDLHRAHPQASAEVRRDRPSDQ